MGQKIDIIEAPAFVPVIWTADDLREEWPEEASRFTDDTIGLQVATSDGDGVLLTGTVEEIYDKAQWMLGKVLQLAKPDSPIFQ